MSYANQALDLATRSGATAQIAWARAYAGGALRNLQRFGEAAESIALAAEMFKAVGDMDAYCQCLTSRANCLREDGRLEEALEMYREACARTAEVFEAIGDAEASSRCHDLATTAP